MTALEEQRGLQHEEELNKLSLVVRETIDKK